MAQTNCPDLTIFDLRYHAFDASKIVVECQNNSSTENYSYPGFVLRNSAADSVAGEVVNFFAIVGDHKATMITVPDLAPLPSPFSGTLELWTLFGETLSCTFPVSESLCPTTECANMEVGIANLGGALVLGIFNYAFTDALGNTVLSGQITMDEQNQMVFSNVCLAPGQYTLTVGTDDFPLMGVPTLTFNEPGMAGDVMLQANINNTTGSAQLNVPFYLSCLEGPNGISGTSLIPNLMLSVNNGQILAKGVAGRVVLIDLSGRVLAEKTAVDGVVRFEVPSVGVYAIREAQTNRAAKVAVIN